MNEKLIAVARIICADNEACGSPQHCPCVEDGCDCLQAARDVIEALREPTEEMCEAGACYYHDNYQPGHAKEQTTAPLIWRAMIDVLLAP